MASADSAPGETPSTPLRTGSLVAQKVRSNPNPAPVPAGADGSAERHTRYEPLASSLLIDSRSASMPNASVRTVKRRAAVASGSGSAPFAIASCIARSK